MTVLLAKTVDLADREASRWRGASQGGAREQGQSRFLATMNRELRTPLDVITGFAELPLIRDLEQMADQRRSYFTDIRNSGSHPLALVNDILCRSARRCST